MIRDLNQKSFHCKKSRDLYLRKALTKDLQKIYGDRLYLEQNKTGLSVWNDINPFLSEVGEELGLKCVATNDVHLCAVFRN